MWSILFMMSMPFLILGGFGTYVYFSIRRARRAAEASASEEEVQATSAIEHAAPKRDRQRELVGS